MIVAIIIICFTQPKTSGMIILFYIEINLKTLKINLLKLILNF